MESNGYAIRPSLLTEARRAATRKQDDSPEDREARLRLYEERHAAGLDIFTGRPYNAPTEPE